MSFESPLGYEQKPAEPPIRAKAGMKAIFWLGALVTVAGAAEDAEAGPKKKGEPKKEAAETFVYKGTMRELPKRDDLDAQHVERKELKDGKLVTVYEGVHLLSDNEVKEERVLDVHVMYDPDPKKDGDERWSECQIIHQTFNDPQRKDNFGYICLDSIGHPDASGLRMDAPAGAYATYEPKDPEYAKMGARPKSSADWTLYELNVLYWAVKGLKETGEDQSAAAKYLMDQFRTKIGQAQSHEKTHPINEDVIKEFIPE